MISYLEHHRIDKNKWDQCVQQAPNALIYARSWYLDIVSPGWNALIEGDYKSVFPLTWKKKYGFYYLHQPCFTQQLGIFSRGKNDPEKTTGKFLESIPDLFRFIEIQLNSGNDCSVKGFKVSERITHHLDLNHSYEKIHNLYSENLKRNIRRASRNNLELSSGVDPADIIRLFRQNRGKEISTLGNKDFKALLHLIETAYREQCITVLGVKNSNGKLSAGAVFIRSDHEYIFFFSAIDVEARTTGAMSLIIDCFIRAHAGEKMNLDFEGSMDKNLARFYKSFGSKEVVYLQIKKNNLPSYIRWIKK
jgi:hypothetical protein